MADTVSPARDEIKRTLDGVRAEIIRNRQRAADKLLAPEIRSAAAALVETLVTQRNELEQQLTRPVVVLPAPVSSEPPPTLVEPPAASVDIPTASPQQSKRQKWPKVKRTPAPIVDSAELSALLATIRRRMNEMRLALMGEQQTNQLDAHAADMRHHVVCEQIIELTQLERTYENLPKLYEELRRLHIALRIEQLNLEARQKSLVAQKRRVAEQFATELRKLERNARKHQAATEAQASAAQHSATHRQQAQPEPQASPLPIKHLPYQLLATRQQSVATILSMIRVEERAAHKEAPPDEERMERIAKILSLAPHQIYAGCDEFTSYYVFTFPETQAAVFDRPYTGHALYLVRGSWQLYARKSKQELRADTSGAVRRLIHTGAWFDRLKQALAQQAA